MYLNWQYRERFPIPITMPREDEEDYDYGYPYSYWYECDYQEGDWEGDDGEEGEKEVEDYYGNALLFLTKAYILGRRVHDEYFQREIVRITKEILDKIMFGNMGFKRGMEVFDKALMIVKDHHDLLLGIGM